MAPNGKTALSGSSDQTLKWWNLETGRVIKTFQKQADSVNAVAFAPDGKTALSGDGSLKWWNLESGRVIRDFQGDSVNAVAFSHDGKTALSADNTLKWWALESGQLIRTFQGYTYPVKIVAFSPDGKTLLSASSDNKINWWNLDNGQLIKTVPEKFINIIAFSPDVKTALSSNDDNSLIWWDLETGVSIKTFEGVNAVAFAPDGKTALSAAEKTLKWWELETGHLLKTFEEHSYPINSLAFSPDGKTALSGGDSLTWWELESGQIIKTYEQAYPINAVAFSPDGKTALSGSDDLRWWDLESGRLIRTFQGHSSYINAVAFAPNGKIALSASEDGSTRLWNLQTGEEIAQLFAFKEGEWATLTGQGYYVASAIGEKYINVSLGHNVTDVESYRVQFNQPELVKLILQIKEIDITPPRIILRPKQQAVFDQVVIEAESYTLQGQVLDDSGVASVTVNDQPTSLDKKGYFSVEIKLKQGNNPIHITANDIYNHSAKSVIFIHKMNCLAETAFSSEDVDTLHKLKVKMAFSVADQAFIVPTDMAPPCLQHVAYLDLSYLNLIELPDWLGKFTELRKLDISHNELAHDKLQSLLETTSVLEILDLSHNPLFEASSFWERIGLKTIPSIPPKLWQNSLRKLNLSDTGGDADNYGDLSRLSHLQSLNISHNRLTTLEALHLQKLKNLRRLNISHNQLDYVDFGQIANDRLQVLNLSFNRLGHLTFSPLPHLNRLFLHRNYNVSFDKKFELQALRSMTFDKGTKVPDGLLKQIGGGNSSKP